MTARGQSLVVTAMMMLVVTLAAFLTFTIGERTRRKINLQALADAGAYSEAVATARAMNFYALSNRAIVGHLVGTLSVTAYGSYLSWYEDALTGAVQTFLNIEGQLRGRAASGPCSGCSARLLAGAQRAHHIATFYAFATPLDKGQQAVDNMGQPFVFPGWPRDSIWVMPGTTPQVSRAVIARPPSTEPDDEGYSYDNECFNLPKRAGRDVIGSRGNCLTNGEYKVPQGPRGAQYVHMQFHAKRNGNWCNLLNSGRADHTNKMLLLRAQQLSVEHELAHRLMGRSYAKVDGTLEREMNIVKMRDWLQEGKQIDSEGRDDEPTLAAGKAFDFFDEEGGDVPLKRTDPDRVPLAEELAKQTAPSARVTDESARLTGESYYAAVHHQMRGDFSHDDFELTAYATRMPEWLYSRAYENGGYLVNDRNWQLLAEGARALAGPDSVRTRAFDYGNAKFLDTDFLSATEPNPGGPCYRQRGNSLTYDTYRPRTNESNNRFLWWDDSYVTGNPTYVNRCTSQNIAWYTHVPIAGRGLADLVGGPTFGIKGAAAADNGFVESSYFVACGACGDASSRVTQYRGRNGIFNRGLRHRSETDATDFYGSHLYHAEAAMVRAHQQGEATQSTDRSYLGHMRFRGNDDPDALWGQPRMTVVLSEPLRKQRAEPWDFAMKLGFLNDTTFRTVDSEGDRAAGYEMAAAAAGLVYYHRPSRWAEAPNLWNPYWRAKLHPIRPDDLARAGNAATRSLLRTLPATVVNE